MMSFIIISGALTIPLLKMEVFPDIEIDMINVTAVYPGASPSDVESAICIKIEERLQGLQGVKKISSNASESLPIGHWEIAPDIATKKVTTDISKIVKFIEAA